MAIVHPPVCLFTSQLSLVLTAPTHGGMARLNWPGWLGYMYLERSPLTNEVIALDQLIATALHYHRQNRFYLSLTYGRLPQHVNLVDSRPCHKVVKKTTENCWSERHHIFRPTRHKTFIFLRCLGGNTVMVTTWSIWNTTRTDRNSPASLNPPIASGGNLRPDPAFSPLHQNCLDFFWNASVTFPRNVLATEPQRMFPISLTVPQIFVGNKGHSNVPDDEKLVSSVSRVRRAAGGKIQRVYPCFYMNSSQWL